jgi:hypothetical protein
VRDCRSSPPCRQELQFLELDLGALGDQPDPAPDGPVSRGIVDDLAVQRDRDPATFAPYLVCVPLANRLLGPQLLQDPPESTLGGLALESMPVVDPEVAAVATGDLDLDALREPAVLIAQAEEDAAARAGLFAATQEPPLEGQDKSS